MNQSSKKYLLISEVAEILNITPAALRYIERKNPKIKVAKIRGRRYYQVKDIDLIKLALISTNDIKEHKTIKATPHPPKATDNTMQPQQILVSRSAKIDNMKLSNVKDSEFLAQLNDLTAQLNAAKARLLRRMNA